MKCEAQSRRDTKKAEGRTDRCNKLFEEKKQKIDVQKDKRDARNKGLPLP